MKQLLLISFAACLGSLGAAQDKPVAPAAAQAPDKPAAKASWPQLKQLEIDRIDQLLENFRKNNPELHAKSLEELVGLGAGAAPLLIARLSDAKANQNDWLIRALDRVTALEHAPLLAAETGHKLVARRRWSVSRLVEVGAPDAAPVYGKALADKDEEVAYRAAVGLASLGDATGMERVFARVKSDWKGCRAWLEPALTRGRCTTVSRFVTDKVASKEFNDKVAALRLFRSAGAREHARTVAGELESSDHGVKKEAINALRVVVLDEKPLDDLSVFQCIEMAKEIKSKL